MIPFKDADQWRISEGYADMTVINTGGCENFATDMLHHIPNGELIGTENVVCWDHTDTWPGGHCWIYDGDKHYDSEALDGVDDWRQLPFFSTRLKELREVTECDCPQVCFVKVNK
ncbi:hypothetical protein ST201phi2-1p345 [Pseudomonas phage 201phi2-1]|uniref:Uncharacterized protein n=1 Tax=Pseudomonas phage 201phi2-1 TaxID=198110 RepID=B3FJK6_BP201|nr:hypothetical protein ST201phi2-1p345 [Pseudomonas phage 201phi2-1]ABY63171.1 hypothetical protein 201phi2-1p345 [Pseudomonas phage 201phi2-1]